MSEPSKRRALGRGLDALLPSAPKAPAVAADGSCIDVYPGPSTTIVGCDGPHELVVVQRVASGEPCPAGTEVRRFGVDDLVDCVKPD